MVDLALLLAVVCTAEVSLQPSPDECRVMWQTQADKATRRGIPLQRQVREFHAMFKPAGTRRLRRQRPWVLALSRDAQAAPTGWAGLNWPGRYRARWRAYLAAADAFVVDPGPALCPQATDYGGRCGDGKAACDRVPSCYRPVECLGGHTLQAYWDTRACRGGTISAKTAAGR